ncbi:MAG: ATP-binding protein [Bacteroidales bacterium]|jgi:signal transduction histidine kinase
MKSGKRNIFLCFVLLILFAGITFSLNLRSKKELNYANNTKQFCETLHGKEKLLNSLLDKIIINLKNTTSKRVLISDFGSYQKAYKESEIAVVVSQHDSTLFWSTNTIPVEDIVLDSLFISEIFHLSNGWYEVRERKYDDYLVRGAILIKREYNYQNDYLKTEFQKDFSLPDNCEIQLVEGEHNIFSSEGYLLGSLLFKKNTTLPDSANHLLFISFILTYIFFISFLILLLESIYTKFNFNRVIFISLICLLILGLRSFLFSFNIPAAIYSLDIFGPKYYAYSEFLPSLGDMLLNLITIFIVGILLFRSLHKERRIKRNIAVPFRIAIAVILFFTIGVVYLFTYYLIRGLIVNSSLSFDLNNIFGLDFYSVIGFLTVAFALLSFFLMAYILAETAFNLNSKKLREYYISLVISIVILGLVNLFSNQLSWFYFAIFILLLVAIGFYLKKDNGKFTIQPIILYIILFALFSTYCFYENNTYKEREKRKLLASQLAVEQDPIAEYLFEGVEKKIISDTLIRREVSAEDADESIITKQIKPDYLNGYFSRYNFQITVCSPKQILINKSDNTKSNCDSFFLAMVHNLGTATMNPDLFILNNGSEKNSYIARLPFYKNEGDSIPYANMYLEFGSKFAPKEPGYPELLINKDIKINKDLYNYSYAKYSNNLLILQSGKYYYSINSNIYNHTDGEFSFFEKDNYDHLFYRIDAKSCLILSKKSEDLLDIIAPFSYIFVFYFLCALTILFILNFPLRMKEINLNFKARVQVSVVSILVFSFITIGISTLYYIVGLYDKKNNDDISEKVHSVQVEVENNLGDAPGITPEMKDYVSDILNKDSYIFSTDINIYTPGGILVASSRPQVFDEGMISRKMDAKAFSELSLSKHTLYIHDENIGNMKYLSAYVPFRNNNNQLAGYINLPYFAKQSELKKEISTFLITFININVILTAIAIIIALLVSNYITRPMKFIKDKLSQIKLGRKNEKIEWTRNDEIGGLINEYNRMIDELAESAELLARSERESAWREMAKQVAHEIKNPLTPMKLSIQHLQRSWEDKAPDWNERLSRFTRTMIEQIESLNKIAAEFSDFAKMPKAKNENVDIAEILENAVELFQDNKLQINIQNTCNEPLIINADKTQVLRIFNNLIKNAAQAINDVEKGKIDIRLSSTETSFLVRISDNGIGITDEQKDKIFSPNFTTKTGGMGLGLAMVKNIVESYQGKIWFESEQSSGTTFFVEFPVLY